MTLSTDRIARLLLVGQREGGMVSVDEAARMLGVPEERVPRLVAALLAGEVGVPPFDVGDEVSLVLEGGWIKVEVPEELGAGWPCHAVDVAAMLAALRAVRPTLPPELRARCLALEDRLRHAVDPTQRDVAEERARSLAWAVSEAADPGVVATLWEAAEARERVQLSVYNASRDVVQLREALALLLLQHGETWYLCARDPDDLGLRWWRVDRILAAERTGEPHDAAPPSPEQVRRPVLFDAPSAPLRVTVRFDAGVAGRAAAWFGGGVVTPEPDGAQTREVETPTIPVLLRRLLAFGHGWEVLAPPDARAALVAWCDLLSPEGATGA